MKACRMTQQAHRKPRALVVEDEALIALNLQDELQNAGYEVAGPFTTCATALEWLRTGTPDVAVLDAVLKDGNCYNISLILSRRQVPFVIYSGYGEDRELLGDLYHVPWIEKPAPPAVVIRACQQLVIDNN